MVALHEMVSTPAAAPAAGAGGAYDRGATEVSLLRDAIGWALTNLDEFPGTVRGMQPQLTALWNWLMQRNRGKWEVQNSPLWAAINQVGFLQAYSTYTEAYFAQLKLGQPKIEDFRRQRGGVEQETESQGGKAWEDWREYFMDKRIRQAAARGYRFVMLGDNHRQHLQSLFPVGGEIILMSKEDYHRNHLTEDRQYGNWPE
jgi:hypothetical protein